VAEDPSEPDPALEVDRLFRAVYLAFHRRDGRRSELSGASRAVLTHLTLAGPLTVGEAAAHLDRAQSVVSDLFSQLEGKGLLEREPDPADRRRTLVWLTAAGFARLEQDQQVLSIPLLRRAWAAMEPADRDAALAGLAALVAAAGPVSDLTDLPDQLEPTTESEEP
jgi:DNA-binding MarR family transcriptional regulator